MERLKVLLVQLDDPQDRKHKHTEIFPNLALMKLSAYHRKQGDVVGFGVSEPDRVYISCIFSKNFTQAAGVAKWFLTGKHPSIYIGGPGAGGGTLTQIDPNIDNIMPDYSLYNVNYSLGFTSRGCVRECPFCLVPSLEGYIRDGTPIECFHHPDHKRIILLDNNFTASPTREHTLDYIQQHKLQVNFSQGLDIRLVDEEFARRLKKTRCYSRTFKHRAVHFAWDLMGYEKQIMQGIENLLNAKYPKDYLTFYVLVGYDTTLVEDLYRIAVLSKYRITPYIMVYNDKKTPLLDSLDRWVNRHLYRVIRLSEMDRLSKQDKVKVEKAEAEVERRLKK